MEDEDNSFEAILWVFLVAILIMAIVYYIYYYLNNNQSPLIPNNKNDEIYNKYQDKDNKDNTETKKLQEFKNNPPPPKLVNLYNEDYKKMENKNDIEYVNKNTILLYNDEQQHDLKKDNDNFEVEIIRPFIKNNTFDSDLEKVYVDDIADNNDPKNNYNEIYDYSVKLQKTDLPIANVPICMLKDNKPLKLSER
jgi:hypothetical protein